MGTQPLPAHGRAAIGHDIVQRSLRPLRVVQVSGLQHFAFIPYHLLDANGVVSAVFRAVAVDAADIPVLSG